MRLVARPDLHFAPVPGGVYFSGTHGQFVLRGSELLFAVAEGCVPLLEPGATEDELVTAIGTERARPAVRHLVDRLRANRMLLDPSAFTVPPPDTAERSRHPEAIARLETLLDDPYAAFARLRAATVLLTGPATATGPAARGLRRAGAGQVTVADSPAAYGGSTETVDAVVVCGAGSAAALPAGIPDGVPVIPVLLGERVTVVGPAVTGPDGGRTWQAFRDRALGWAAAQNTEPAARPVADALAGALAGQLVFDALTGTADMGEAHVVHGTALVADRVTVEGAHMAAATGRPSSLEDAPAEPMPEPEDALAAAGALTRRWTGLFASGAGEDLPQMPLALRPAEPRADRTGAVVGWAGHQETATIAAALQALRARSPEGGTPAAGLTEQHWLLDGALRELTPSAAPLADVTPDHLDPEAARILGAVRPLLPDAPTLELLHLPGLDWRLARVAGAGDVLGLGWGASAQEATRTALCTALARLQTAGDGEGWVADVSTDALLFAGADVLGALRKQLTTHAEESGLVLRGRAVRSDAVLGELPLWYGPVEAAARAPRTQDTQETQDAN